MHAANRAVKTGPGRFLGAVGARAFILFFLSAPAAAAPLVVGDPAGLPRLSPDPAAALRASPAFAMVADTVRADLEDGLRALAARRATYTGGTVWFDPTWLTSPETRFVLAAVVHRPDRALVLPETCGETRLVYRLQRREELPGGGALPFMMTLVHAVPRAADCGAYWRAPEPLEALVARGFSRVEINLQSSRWAGDGKGRFLDQVRYLMRVFAPDAAGGLKIAPLENSPDVERLGASPRLRAALLDWLAAPGTLAAIDAGRALLPENFLALRAESVTPLGLARLANRPFSAAFAPAAFARLPLAAFPRLQTPAGLLRRLDTLTCVGCHQSASMAGFHVLGRETAVVDGPGLRAPFSVHFMAMQPWREAFALTQSGLVPDPERVALAGRSGGPCGLGDAAFSGWTCDAGLVCHAAPLAVAPALGVCTPPVPMADGDPCERAGLTAQWHGERDDFRELELLECGGGGVCASTANGFPSGMCSTLCSADTPSTRCAPVPTLGPFSGCRDAGGSFASCLARFHVRTAMRRCQVSADCRPDYVCLDFDVESGICSPPYVSPRLSVEHHR